MADPRKNNFVRPPHPLRIRRDRRLAPQGIERLHHRGQVAGFVVNDSDHSNPLVLGSISPNCLSLEHATRSARANALNSASILWWLDRPYMVAMCTLARAPRAKPSKKSSPNSH